MWLRMHLYRKIIIFIGNGIKVGTTTKEYVNVPCYFSTLRNCVKYKYSENLIVTTTSIIKYITCDLFTNVF